jgi:hypothetical protein
MKNWAEKEYEQRVYYDTEDGKIIGSVYKVGNNHSIWGAQVYSKNNESVILGQYINLDYAKRGVEYFWEVQSRTLIEHHTMED